MAVVAIVNEALRRLQAWGLDRVLYRIWRYNPVALRRLIGHYLFDLRHGVVTRGYGDLRYEPTPAGAFVETIRSLEAVATELGELTFVDIGSGKGKAVLLASTFPFKKVVGVELYDEFHRLARENLERFTRAARRCVDVELVLADAARYPVPDGPVALYFFNPFPLEVLERVLANIETAVRRDPERPLYVIYYAPILFRETPWDRRLIFDRSPCLVAERASRAFTLYRGVSIMAR